MSCNQGSGLSILARVSAVFRGRNPLGLLALVVTFASTVQGQRSTSQATTHYRNPLLLEAQTLLSQGHTAEAAEKLTQAVAENPSSVEAYNLLGIIYTSEKDFSHA